MKKLREYRIVYWSSDFYGSGCQVKMETTIYAFSKSHAKSQFYKKYRKPIYSIKEIFHEC